MVIRWRALLVAAAAVSLSACRRDMQDQPRFKPLQRSSFFPDGRSARPLIEGTIARGHLQLNTAFFRGQVNGQFVSTPPLTVDAALLARGRDRFDIYCSPCHGRAGDGRGMVALRGFRYPPSFHSDRLRGVPDGYIYAVIANGYGAMSNYAYQLEPRDRWAVTEYVRVLQFSRNAQAADLDASDRDALDRTAAPGGAR